MHDTPESIADLFASDRASDFVVFASGKSRHLSDFTAFQDNYPITVCHVMVEDHWLTLATDDSLKWCQNCVKSARKVKVG